MKIRHTLTAVIILFITNVAFTQAPPLGTASDFVLFSTNGGVSNTGTSQVTGDVGTNSGTSTGFGNINGSIHDNDLVSALAASDVVVAYNQLNSTVATAFPAPLLGNGQVLTPGVYSIATAATLSLNLTLDAQGDTNAVFIFKIQGSLITGLNAQVNLINGASPCNVFWKVEGLVNIAPGTNMRGTIISNNGPVIITGATLEGRALAINGSIAVNTITAFIPTVCDCPMMNGPLAPAEGSTACYALFTSNGTLTNTGATFATGDIGSNNGTATGYNPATISGTIHPVPDGSTAASAADLTTMYNYLNVLTPDIQLMAPSQFGNGLTLTPHTYLLNANTILNDTLYLNANGNANAVFVIKVNGTFTANANSQVVLINGTQAQNVYWKIEDDVILHASSDFNGTIVSQGNITLHPGVMINGRVLTTAGNVTTNTVNVTLPSCCPPFPAPVITSQPVSQTVCIGDSVSFVVSATGVGLTYQWRRGNVNIAGATNDTLTIDPVQLSDAGNDYNVIVSGSCTGQDTSVNVSLIINTTTITSQPVSQTVCEGDSVMFIVGTSGSSVTYQWQKGNVNIANAPGISGVNDDTLIFYPVPLGYAANDYSVIVSGGCSGPDTSVYVSLTVNPTVTNTIIPANEVVCVGSSVTFTSSVTGAGVTYQWIHNNIPIPGATDDSLTINPATLADAGSYMVIVSGGCTDNDSSNTANLAVNLGPAITTQPASQTICEGDSVSFVVGTTGSGLTFQWQKGGVNIMDGPGISGSTNDTLTFSAAPLGYAANDYTVIVTGGGCSGSDTSVNVSLIINQIESNIIFPSNEVVCVGNSVSFVAGINGAGITYQWLHNNLPIIGATNDTLTITTATPLDGGTYSVIISGGCPDSDTSNTATLTVNFGSSIVLQPTSQTICEGDSVSFVVVTTGAGLTFQWQKGGVNIMDGPGISGSTNDTLTFSAAPLGYAANDYTVIVTGGGCNGSDTSVNVSLVINTPLNIVSQPTDVTACVGDTATFVVGVTGIGATYQWIHDSVLIAGANNDTLTIFPVTPIDGGVYSVIVSGGCNAPDTSVNVNLIINTPPVIVLQPISQTVCEGDSVTFTVTAAGIGLTYQWQLNNVNIAGATNDSLTINPVVTGDGGVYTVIISGTGMCTGSDTSAAATLTINTPPAITLQPISQTVCFGDSTSFIVGASGTGVTYQWRRGTINLVNSINMTGVNNDTLTFDPVFTSNIAGNYNVIVSSAGCPGSDTSINVSLNMHMDPTILVEPVSQTACLGDSVSFVAVTNGVGLTYQWRRGTINLTNGINITGVNNDTLTINPVFISDQAGNYNLIVSSTVCPGSDTSVNVALIVNTPPAITTQPVSQTVCQGDSVSLVVGATGTGATYQWSQNGIIIPGAINDTLTFDPVTVLNNGDYEVVVSGICGDNDTSASVSLAVGLDSVIITQPISQTVCTGDSVIFVVGTVGAGFTFQWYLDSIAITGAVNDTLVINPASITNSGNYYVIVSGGCSPDTSLSASLGIQASPIFFTQPVSQTVCEGDSASFTVVAVGNGLTYQWTIDGMNIPGETNDTLTINPVLLTDSGIYNVIVTDVCSVSDTSDDVSLTINPDSVITTQPVSQTVCAGDSVSFVVGTTGTGLSFQWMNGLLPIVGATNDTLTFSSAQVTDSSSNYYVIVNGGCAGADTSVSVSLTVNSDSVIITQPISQTVCTGDSVIFVVGTVGAGFTFQWYLDSIAITGAVNDTLVINPASITNSGIYYVIVSGGCSPDTSLSASLGIIADPIIFTQPASQTVCEGDSATFSVTAVGTGITYQWLYNNTTIAGATNDTLTIATVSSTDAGNYSVIVTGVCGSSDTSATVTLTINPDSVITTQPVSQTVCAGDSVSFVVGTAGTGLTFQWMNGLLPIAGATNDTLTFSSAQVTDSSSNYYVIVNGGCAGADTSVSVSLTIDSTGTILIQPVSQTACEGDSVTFSITTTGTGVTYQWYNDNIAVTGATNDSLTITNITAADAGTYYVIVSGTCAGSDTSATVTLTIDSATTITTHPVSQTVCEGDSVSFTVAATGSGLTYQWMNGSTPIAGANNDTLTINAATMADTSSNYYVIVMGSCGNETSSSVSLTINTASAIISQPVSQTVCEGDSVSFVVSTTGTNVTYQWMNGNTAVAGATNDTLTFNSVALADTSSNYYVIVSGPCSANDTSAIVSLNVNPATAITTQPVSQTVCAGDSVSFVVSATGTGVTYQWMIGNTPIVGANNDTLTFDPATTANAGNNYNVIVSGGCSGSDTSLNVSLTVNTAPVINTQPASQTVCENDSVSFVAGATGTNVTYQWMNGNTAIAGATNSTYTINPVTLADASTNYYVVVSGTCSPNDTSTIVSLTVNPAPDAIVTGETDICLNSSISLSAQAVAGATYSWTGPNGFTANTQNIFIAFAALNSAGTYNLTVTANGCTSTVSSTTISVSDCDTLIGVTIPEGFSPNADMINDLFVIRGILDFPANTFNIYNRWGVRVYEAGPYTNTWDGTATEGLIIDDGVLPVGTYFYVLDLGNGTDPIKGTIFLNR